MKYINIILLSIITISFTSCSRYVAISESTQSDPFQVTTVIPSWEHKGSNASRWLLPAVSAGAGVYYGYRNNFSYEDKVYKGNTSAAIWGGIGAIGAVVINNWLFNNKNNLVGWKNRKTGEVKMSRTAENPEPIAFSGIHIISPELFSLFQQKGKFSIVQTYLEVAKENKIKGYLHDDDYWIDVGKKETLKQANDLFKQFNPEYLKAI